MFATYLKAPYALRNVFDFPTTSLNFVLYADALTSQPRST